jgi:hypothetical protein
MIQSQHFNGDNAEKIFNDCELKLSDLLSAKTLSTQLGLENLDLSLQLYKDLHHLHSDSFDHEKFNKKLGLKIETKYEFSNHYEYWETIKVVSFDNNEANETPFMIILIKGDDSPLETVINHNKYNVFIETLKNCMKEIEPLTKPELESEGIFKF